MQPVFYVFLPSSAMLIYTTIYIISFLDGCALGCCQNCMKLTAQNKPGRRCTHCKLHQSLCAQCLVQTVLLWSVHWRTHWAITQKNTVRKYFAAEAWNHAFFWLMSEKHKSASSSTTPINKQQKATCNEEKLRHTIPALKKVTQC